MPTTNPDDLRSFFTSGGLVTLAGVIGYTVKLALNAAKQRLTLHRPGVPLAEVTDASTANAVVVNSLKAVAEENTRLNKRIEELNVHIQQLEKLVDELRSHNE